MSEPDVLGDHAKRRPDGALVDLVSRYVDLVYSSALRQLGDAHQAEDVLHAVFILLKKQASSLQRKPILPAWLLETTRQAVINTHHGDDRRQKKEAEAKAVPPDGSDAAADVTAKPANACDAILPMLDEAIERLSEDDRRALVLRYFDMRPLPDVGKALSISQDTAFKRISRALENMRLYFYRRGVVVKVTALSLGLPSRTVMPAPPEVRERILAALTTTQASERAGAGSLVKKALKTMAVKRLKRVAAWGAAVLLTIVTGAYALRYFLTPKEIHYTIVERPVDPSGPVTGRNTTNAVDEARSRSYEEVPETRVQPPRQPPVFDPSPRPQPAPVTAPKPEALSRVLARLPLRVPAKEPFADLTWLIDPELDAVVGAWVRENGVLRSDEALFASLEVPYYPPAEYDLRVTCRPLVARDAMVLLPMHGITSFLWKMGADGNSASLFELAGKTTAQNETAFRLNDMFAANERVTCVIEVRSTGVRAYLNERLIGGMETDFQNMGNFGFWNPRNPGVLGIGSCGTPTQFEKIEIAEIRGKGGPLRKPGEVVTRPPRTPLPDEIKWRAAENLLTKVNPARDTIAGVWSQRGGDLSSNKAARARIHIPYQPPEEYDLRVKFVHPSTEGEVEILLPRGEAAAAFRVFIPGAWAAGFSSEDENQGPNPTWCFMPNPPDEGKWSVVLCVRKEGVRAYLNGMPMSNLTAEYPMLNVPAAWKLTDSSCLGLGSDQNQTVFNAVELIPVTGEGKAVVPQKEQVGAKGRD